MGFPTAVDTVLHLDTLRSCILVPYTQYQTSVSFASEVLTDTFLRGPVLLSHNYSFTSSAERWKSWRVTCLPRVDPNQCFGGSLKAKVPCFEVSIILLRCTSYQTET